MDALDRQQLRQWARYGASLVALTLAITLIERDGVAGAVESAALLAVGYAVWRWLSRVQAVEALQREAVAMLAQGRYAEAQGRFEAVRAPRRGALADDFNVGWAQLLQWRLRESVATLEAAHRVDTGSDQLLSREVPALLLAAALLGDFEGYVEWDAQSQALKVDDAPLAVLGRAAMACRTARWDDVRALKRLPADAFTGMPQALAKALLGWSAEQRLGEGARVVEPSAVFGQASAAAVAALWPELVAYLDRCEARAGLPSTHIH